MAITEHDIAAMSSFYKVRKGLHDSLKVNVQIDHEQVNYLVITELMKIYMHPANNRPEHFKKCLLHYLEPDEFNELLEKWGEIKP